jgi:AmmeMemoRadiSam system protein A
LNPLVELAQQTIETYVRTGEIITPPAKLSPEMTGKAGVFVSLKKHGELRGCIGTIASTTGSVAEEVIRNAIEAATRDPRFPPVLKDELGELEISVDVLGEPEPASSVKDLDVKRFGVIVKSGHRRGLLLPNLEGVDSPEEQIAICRRKAGIGPEEPVELFRFEVRRYK